MSNRITDRDLGMGRLFRELRRMKGSHTRVGIQAGARHRGKKGTTDLVTVALANEFGVPADSDDKRIPERSFLRSTFDENQDTLQAAMGVAKDLIFSGELTTEQALDQVGLLHASQVQAKIRSNIPPPNAESTVRRKGSTGTLRDTGQLLQGIRHVVKIKGEA